MLKVSGMNRPSFFKPMPVVSDFLVNHDGKTVPCRCYCLVEWPGYSDFTIEGLVKRYHHRSIGELAGMMIDLGLKYDEFDPGYDWRENPDGFKGYGTLPEPEKNISDGDYRFLSPTEIKELITYLEEYEFSGVRESLREFRRPRFLGILRDD